MTDNLITVFTPSYNRAYTLPRLFESLKRQTIRQFNWLVIDDGSSDNTKELVEKFSNEADFAITYVKKENGGKHTAINSMLDMIDTELVVIVDSDDFLAENAVEIILNDYMDIKCKSELCSINYLRAYFDGSVIGDPFPDDHIIAKANQYMINGGIAGDKCEVFLAHALKNYRFPVFSGERFVGETAVWIPMYRNYKTLFRNEAIYYCQYIDDGLSMAGKSMRIKNPLGGMENSLVYIANDIKLSLRIKHTLLYICYGKFAKKSLAQIMDRFPDKLSAAIMYLPGYLLYLDWKKKYCK